MLTDRLCDTREVQWENTSFHILSPLSPSFTSFIQLTDSTDLRFATRTQFQRFRFLVASIPKHGPQVLGSLSGLVHELHITSHKRVRAELPKHIIFSTRWPAYSYTWRDYGDTLQLHQLLKSLRLPESKQQQSRFSRTRTFKHLIAMRIPRGFTTLKFYA